MNGAQHTPACEFDQAHGYDCTCGVQLRARLNAIHAKIAAWVGDADLGTGLLREIYDLSTPDQDGESTAIRALPSPDAGKR
jgi:hypothetical protein